MNRTADLTVDREGTDARLLEELDELRLRLRNATSLKQRQLEEITARWSRFKIALRPRDKDEPLNLVDARGKFLDLSAPRWLCHLLALRHRSVHVLLRWQSPHLGSVFVFQVRSWSKSDYPGHLDISVGGHVVGKKAHIVERTAFREMQEELGVTAEDLRDGQLRYHGGYESYAVDRPNHLYDLEWRDVYSSELLTDRFSRITFADREVAGLYLCPEYEANRLLSQNTLPLASGLELSLPHYLERIQPGLRITDVAATRS